MEKNSTDRFHGDALDIPVSRRAAEVGDHPAIFDRGVTWSFREVNRLVDAVAVKLQTLGVKSGDVVSWQLPNWAAGIVAHFAILRLDAVSNPLGTILRERELEFILSQSKSKVLIVTNEFRRFSFREMAERLEAKVEGLRSLLVSEDPKAPFGVDARMEFSRQEVRGTRHRALLMYTSGTTSDPKGAIHTHESLGYDASSVVDLYELTSSDTIFMASPITHIAGLLYGVHLPFILGTKVVLMDIWEARKAVDLISEHSAAFTFGATPFLHGILAALAPSERSPLRVFSTGGADVPPHLVRAATERLQCFVTRLYGSTEFPSATSSGLCDSLEKCATTDGKPILGARVRVVSEGGETCAIGAVGEIEAQGPELFAGYLDESLNAAAFTPDGWFRTGDLGSLDTEGFLTITGRKKDVILRGGETISAKEIEDLIHEHPSIVQAAVVGKKDPVMVERICAFVVVKPGLQLSHEDLTSFLRGHRIANQKLPEFLHVVESLPQTPSGKVQKFKLREILMDEDSSSSDNCLQGLKQAPLNRTGF